MSWLLDTNILSESRRLRPEPRVTSFLSSHALSELYISSVTLAEIRYGIVRSPDPARRRDLEVWLLNDVRPTFSGRVLDITEDTMLRWRLLIEEGRQSAGPTRSPTF